MSRKEIHPFENPWLLQIDSVEKKLMNYSPAKRQVIPAEIKPHAWIQCGQRTDLVLQQLAQNLDELLYNANGWLQVGWLSQQGLECIRQLQKLGLELQTSTVTGKSSSQLEEYQQLVQQMMPTLERINQRIHNQNMPTTLSGGVEDSVEVALRVAMKRRMS